MNTVLKNGENVDFKIDAGSTWSINMTWQNNDGTPIDLGGYIGRMFLKRTYTSPSAFDITTANGRMLLGLGTIAWSIPPALTSTLSGSYLYDIELQSFNGDVTRLYQGTIVVSPEVTK